MAVDLLAERPNRASRHATRAPPALRDARPRQPARPPGSRARERRPVGRRLWPRPGRDGRLDERRGARDDRRGHRIPRRFRRLGAARGRADAADALLPEPHLRRDERRLARHVLRDVRVDLPARAVPPGRAGLLAARGGDPDASVDGDADLRRTDRGRALRPDRRTAAHGDRPCAPGRRARVAGGDHPRGRSLRRARSAVPHGRSRDGALLRAGRERRALGGLPLGGGQGVGREQRDSGARRRFRRGGARVDLLDVRRATRRRLRTWTA